MQKSGIPFSDKLIPPNYIYPKGSKRIAHYRGIKLNLDISEVVDHFIYWNLDSDDFKSIEGHIRSSSIIFDIGANIGSTSLYFSILNPQSRIFSFEPNLQTFNRFLKNIDLNQVDNIHPFNIGLGEMKTTLNLYEVDEHNPGMNRILPRQENFPFTTIEIESLDAFCLEQNISSIDFIKIDVEGYEFAVLFGGKNILSKNKPLIFLELDDNNLGDNNQSAKMLIQLLFELGYSNIRRVDTGEKISLDYTFKNCHFDIIAS